MIINIFVDGIYKSGGMKVIFEYANRLSGKGHDVILYYPLFPYNFYKGEINLKSIFKNIIHRIRYYTKHRKDIFRDYCCKFKVKGILNYELFVRDADISIATRWPTSYFVDKLHKDKGEKIYFIQGYETWNSNVEYVDRSFSLNLNRVTISSAMKKLLQERFNADSEVVLNGIDFNVFFNENKIIGKNRDILFIDRDQKLKGIEDLLVIIESIHRKYPDISFTCFSFRKYHEFPEYVKLVENPDRDTIRKLYSSSDIFIFSSLIEGFGLPPAEAMACKCAVVTTNVGAIPDYAEHNFSAVISEPGDIDGMLKNIELLLGNDDFLKYISLNGYNSVRDKLSWDRSVLALENIFRRID